MQLFFYSYNIPNTKPTNSYDELQPFVDYVVSIHDNADTLDLVTLKKYAKTFKHPNLNFQNCN